MDLCFTVWKQKRDPFLPRALLSAILQAFLLLLLFLKTKALDSLINSSQALAAPAAVNKMALNQPDSLLSQQPS